ncbi:hypothetical protein HIM_00622 [Hirsutella minnesotensis 3608]|nr:hypothetical protein HIM_00622 [Hirsutella minnesotensis 3608]
MAYSDLSDSPLNQEAATESSRFPELEPVAHDEKQPSSRQGKLGRRESRLGLKNIFGRSKAHKEADPTPRTTQAPRSMRIRASIADLGNWHHSNHSDVTVSSPTTTWTHLPPTPEFPLPETVAPESPPQRRGTMKQTKQSKPTLANWSMPPLYKAFPQAIRHVTLPATSMSSDAILRLNEKRHAMDAVEEATSFPLSPLDGHRVDKRKHRRDPSISAHSLEWTTKIFVLVTSGYLLQYAGDGHFDRLPEKALRLGPCSAAFATDAIPGRHWVVRVSATAEADGIPAPESRSIFSKLPFWMDRRSTSNLLMVFEGADVMETWITILRGEIERLGGKRNLSETGRPKTMETSHVLRDRPSKRHLMARSLPRLRSQDNHQPAMPRLRSARSSDGPAQIIGPDAVPDAAADDDSTSNSGISHDERQLENLREHSHRLSLVSSGQRTIITSAGPSPEGSPTREHLAAHAGEAQAHMIEPPSAISHHASGPSGHRQSMQMAVPIVEPVQQDHAGMRPPSTCAVSIRGDGAVSPLGLHQTPNFSLPQSSNRRFSHARIVVGEVDGDLYSERSTEPSRLARGKPPPALRATRALSVVMDQPPLREATPQRPMTGYTHSQPSSPTKYAHKLRLRSASRGRDRLDGAGTGWSRDGAAPRTGRSMPPRRHQEPPSGLRSPPLTPQDGEFDKYQSSFLDMGSPQSACNGPASAASVMTDESCESYRPLVMEPPQTTVQNHSLPPRILPHASNPHLKVQFTEKALLNRSSMPQLTEGPPPAPPPNRALPPIPQNLDARP